MDVKTSIWRWFAVDKLSRFVGLEFNVPVNTIKVMSSRLVYLTSLFSLLIGYNYTQYLYTFFRQKLTTVLLESERGRMVVEKCFMINLHNVPNPGVCVCGGGGVVDAVTSWSLVGRAANWATEAS